MHNILAYLCGVTINGGVDRIGFWTFVSSSGVFLAAVIALWQLNAINKTAKADFIHRFTEGFINKECRTLIMLFEYKLLKFKVKENNVIDGKDFTYFALDINLLNKVAELDSKEKDKLRQIYAAYEIDDHLLGFFEDLGTYEKKGLIDIDMIYDGFSWYMGKILENEDIKEYLKSELQHGEDTWENTKDIYGRIKSYAWWKERKLKLLWQIKDWVCTYR